MQQLGLRIVGCFIIGNLAAEHETGSGLAPSVCPRRGLAILFAYLLTLIETEHAGRAYAAYGGVYITASLLWLWVIEAAKPDRWDVIGAGVCLGGAAIILFGPRQA